MQDIIIKHKKQKTSIMINVVVPAVRNVTQKEAERTKIQEFMYRDTMNMECDMYDHISNNCSQGNSNKRFTEKSGSHTKTTFTRFTTTDLEHHT
jgi:hypothetical protein